MEKESHGRHKSWWDKLSTSRKKKLPITCSMDPWVLVESFNRTRWLDKLRPAGASQKGMGRRARWPYRDHWCSHGRKKTLSRVILVLEATLFFLCRATEDPRIVRVILAPKPWNFRRIEKKEPCKSFNKYLHFSNYACQPCTGAMQILFKSLTCNLNRGHAALLLPSKKNSTYVSSLHKGPCKFSRCKKKSATDSM